MSTSSDPRDRERNAHRRSADDRSRDGSRYDSGYRSGRTLFIWIAGTVSLMVVLAFVLAWVDSKMLNDITAFRSVGLTDLPRNNANPGELLSFAADQGFHCDTAQDLAAGTGDCRRVLEIARTVNDYHSDQSLVWSFVVLSVITLLVSFTMFIHQASSNLQHLRITGQKFSPGWSVGWFFIPFMNIYKPTRIVRELSTASGSTDTKNPRAWQNATPQDGRFISSW